MIYSVYVDTDFLDGDDFNRTMTDKKRNVAEESPEGAKPKAKAAKQEQSWKLIWKRSRREHSDSLDRGAVARLEGSNKGFQEKQSRACAAEANMRRTRTVV